MENKGDGWIDGGSIINQADFKVFPSTTHQKYAYVLDVIIKCKEDQMRDDGWMGHICL